MYLTTESDVPSFALEAWKSINQRVQDFLRNKRRLDAIQKIADNNPGNSDAKRYLILARKAGAFLNNLQQEHYDELMIRWANLPLEYNQKLDEDKLGKPDLGYFAYNDLMTFNPSLALRYQTRLALGNVGFRDNWERLAEAMEIYREIATMVLGLNVDPNYSPFAQFQVLGLPWYSDVSAVKDTMEKVLLELQSLSQVQLDSLDLEVAPFDWDYLRLQRIAQPQYQEALRLFSAYVTPEKLLQKMISFIEQYLNIDIGQTRVLFRGVDMLRLKLSRNGEYIGDILMDDLEREGKYDLPFAVQLGGASFGKPLSIISSMLKAPVEYKPGDIFGHEWFHGFVTSVCQTVSPVQSMIMVDDLEVHSTAMQWLFASEFYLEDLLEGTGAPEWLASTLAEVSPMHDHIYWLHQIENAYIAWNIFSLEKPTIEDLALAAAQAVKKVKGKRFTIDSRVRPILGAYDQLIREDYGALLFVTYVHAWYQLYRLFGAEELSKDVFIARFQVLFERMFVEFGQHDREETWQEILSIH